MLYDFIYLMLLNVNEVRLLKLFLSTDFKAKQDFVVLCQMLTIILVSDESFLFVFP